MFLRRTVYLFFIICELWVLTIILDIELYYLNYLFGGVSFSLLALLIIEIYMMVKACQARYDVKRLIASHNTFLVGRGWKLVQGSAVISLQRTRCDLKYTHQLMRVCNTSPKSTPHTIVFRYDRWKNSFSTDQKIDQGTDSLLSEAEIQNFLNQVAKVMKDTGFTFEDKLQWITKVLFLGTLLFIWIGVFVFPQQTEPDQIDIVLVVTKFFMLLYFFWMIVYLRFTSDIQFRIREPILVLIQDANKSQEQKGLRWHISSGFPQWIELWKDYSFYAQPSAEESLDNEINDVQSMQTRLVEYPVHPSHALDYQQP